MLLAMGRFRLPISAQCVPRRTQNFQRVSAQCVPLQNRTSKCHQSSDFRPSFQCNGCPSGDPQSTCDVFSELCVCVAENMRGYGYYQAEERAREAEKCAQENEECILRSTRGRLEALQTLEKVQAKEAMAAQKMAKLKALRDAESSDRPDSASSVSSVDSSRPTSGVSIPTEHSAREGSALARLCSGPLDGGEDELASPRTTNSSKTIKTSELPDIAPGMKKRITTVSEMETADSSGIKGTPKLAAIERNATNAGGVGSGVGNAPTATPATVKLPSINNTMAAASTARTVPISMNNN
eukprot:m.34254 g.34254  ORF g.34254 m.34254 type:complete len:297 (-) comp14287_c0_seq8:1322-2212(-)